MWYVLDMYFSNVSAFSPHIRVNNDLRAASHCPVFYVIRTGFELRQNCVSYGGFIQSSWERSQIDWLIVHRSTVDPHWEYLSNVLTVMSRRRVAVGAANETGASPFRAKQSRRGQADDLDPPVTYRIHHPQIIASSQSQLTRDISERVSVTMSSVKLTRKVIIHATLKLTTTYISYFS